MASSDSGHILERVVIGLMRGFFWFGTSDVAGSGSSGNARGGRSDARRVAATVQAPASDETLFARVCQGNEQALTTLYERHATALHREAQSLLHSRDEAWDVVQAVFVRIWNRRAELAVPDRVVGYLHRAVYNAARDAMRGARREEERRRRGIRDQQTDESIAFHDAGVGTEELTRVVADAIAGLPGRTGEVFRLWWRGGLTYAQIAEAMGISVKGVEQGRARALLLLREALRGYWP